MADHLVEIRSVFKSFAHQRDTVNALANVSLAIDRGRFVSVIGPSGCGKSTLLNLVAGLDAPDRGEVLFDGRPLAGPNTAVGYMTQDDALLPWRTVRGNITLPMEIQGILAGERNRRADEIIAKVGLAGFERHLPSRLSGGMRKRVSLARTLVYGARTLLLDEPFGALDAQTRLVMQQLLRGLSDSLALTVLLITHDLDEAVALSDQVVVFSARPGRIIATVDQARTPGMGAEIIERSEEAEKLRRRLWSLLINDRAQVQ